jgi:periplasmic protein TonB
MENKPDFDNIVFEDRNKAYGAFHLRKFYKNSVLTGFLISALFFSVALCAPLAYSKFFTKEQEEEISKEIVVDMIKVEEPLPEEEIKLPEPEKVEEVATAKNLELDVKPDEEVKVEEIPPTDEEMKDKQSGKENKEGSDIVKVATDPIPEVKQELPKIETWAPEMPQFPGGPSELLKFYRNNLEYTVRAEAEGIEGTVRVSFVVNTDGSITDIKIVKGLGYGLDEEVLKGLKKMPKWKPARKGGKEVPLRMVTPVVFTLED